MLFWNNKWNFDIETSNNDDDNNNNNNNNNNSNNNNYSNNNNNNDNRNQSIRTSRAQLFDVDPTLAYHRTESS